jgi:hypothetical protein
MVDIMHSHADPRSLRRAQNAETQRMQCTKRSRVECDRIREHESAQQAATRVDATRREEENDQRRSRCLMPGVLERESAQRRVDATSHTIMLRYGSPMAVAAPVTTLVARRYSWSITD